MRNNGATYSQRLKPNQVQKVFDALGIPWRKYDHSSKGWFSIPGEEFHSIVSAAGHEITPLIEPSFNIKHGGYVDHWFNGLINSRDELDENVEVYDELSDDFVLREKKSAKGDIVDLVKLFLFKNDQTKETTVQAIQWINQKLGIGEKPLLCENEMFFKEMIAAGRENYAMIPRSILRSSEISASAKLVWIAIQERCGKNRNYSFPSITTISEDTDLSRSTVQRALEDLKNERYLIEIPKGERKSPKRFPICKIELPETEIE